MTNNRTLTNFFMAPTLPVERRYDCRLSSQVRRVDSLRNMIRFTLAHGSGIDDVLWFVVPVLLAIAVLRATERRARRRTDPTEQRTPDIDEN